MLWLGRAKCVLFLVTFDSGYGVGSSVLFIVANMMSEMPRYSLKPGGLIVEDLPYEGASPAWCSHRQNPKVHRLSVLWMPRFEEHKDGDGETETLLKSPTFSFGRNWLKGNLTAEFPCTVPGFTPRNSDTFLQVSPGHERKVQGLIKATISKTEKVFTNLKVSDEFKEFLFSPANLDQSCGWYMGSYNLIKYNITVNLVIDFTIIDDMDDAAFQQTKLCNDFALIIEDKGSTDITIKVGATELGAHKCILGARSPVLKVMLDADMVEGRTGVIELKNMSVAAAEAFLAYIYTARIDKEKLTETAEELLPAAAMYEMPDLKAICETTLCETISVNNAAKFMLLACIHDAVLLKSTSLDFFLKNKSAVMKTEEWKECVADNSNLILEKIVSLL